MHPQAKGVVESERFGNIRTQQGEPGYVLQTGELVRLGPRGEHLWKGEKPLPADLENYVVTIPG